LILEKREKKKEARNLYIQRCAGFFVRYNKIAYFSRGCSLNRAQIRDILFNGFHLHFKSKITKNQHFCWFSDKQSLIMQLIFNN
jgi:hypothetical protein